MAKAKTTTKKVRQPKTKVTKAKFKKEKSEEDMSYTPSPVSDPVPVVKKEVVSKPLPAVDPSAQVTLTKCASLVRHGRKHFQGKSFVVRGQDKIDYYKADPRFEVLDQK